MGIGFVQTRNHSGRTHIAVFRTFLERVKQRPKPPHAARRWEVIAPSDENKFYQLAACLIFKNEADYLNEWINFHRLVGVEKFFLYNNNSEDDYERVLGPYVAEGVVTLHDIPIRHPSAQVEAYNSCLRTYRRHARWIAFIDIDEFLCAPEDDSVLNVLRDYDQYPAIALNWLMFCTSGHILKPEGLVIENYTRCQAGGNRHVRLITNPLKTERFVSAHEAIYYDGRYAVNEGREEVRGPYSTPPSIARLRVNHYWTKSVEEYFLKKLSRGDVAGVTDLRDIEGLLLAERDYNTGDDYAIQRFTARVKSVSAQFANRS